MKISIWLNIKIIFRTLKKIFKSYLIEFEVICAIEDNIYTEDCIISEATW